jgi:hypothetical protein
LELVAWGFRNPFGLAFASGGALFVTDNGYDDRGSRAVWGTGDYLWDVVTDGGGPVVQILPGPAVFADSADSTIQKFPEKLQQRFSQVAQMGPFSDSTAQISGDLSITMKDRGATGDAVSDSAEFTSQDGTNLALRVRPRQPRRQIAVRPALRRRDHGLSLSRSDREAHPAHGARRDRSIYVGRCARLPRRRTRQGRGPFHFMLTNKTRSGAEQDFEYICYTCSPGKVMNQVHLVSRTPPSMGPLYTRTRRAAFSTLAGKMLPSNVQAHSDSK